MSRNVPFLDDPYLVRHASKRRWVVACAAVVLIALIALGLFALAAYSWIQFDIPEAPPELKQAEVRLGKGLLQKSIFFADVQLGNVTDIILDPLPGARFGVAGVGGAVFLKADRTAQSRVTFQPATRKSLGFPLTPTCVQFLDLDGHHKWAFLNRGGTGWQDASLIGPDGQTLWVSGGMPGVDDMTAGNLDGASGSDSAPQFVVGFNGDGGLRCLDVKGVLKWQKLGANIWHVEIVDIKDNGQPKIVHSDASGGITVRNRDGDVEREIKPVEYCAHFSVCRWPSASSEPKLVIPGKGQIWLADFDGNLIAGLKAPSWEGAFPVIHATAFRLKEDEPPFLATVTNYSLWNASVLTVFNGEKQPVYEEIITEQCATLRALPVEGSAVDDLLVGGNGKVWRYTAAETAVGKKK
jgi:hypothetical protein